MFVKKRRQSTDPLLRSLLQKAVRRGYADLARQVATRLYELGDSRWLRSRTVVLAYEECWPIAAEMHLNESPLSKIEWVRKIAAMKKNKEATGLGTLAYALSEGDSSVLPHAVDERAVRLVAAAISRPKEFWYWIDDEARRVNRSQYVSNAQRYISAATWPWDRAFIMASAVLSLTTDQKRLNIAPLTVGEFPYWVAVDKHTPEGREGLRRVSKAMRVGYRELAWASFYFESAVVNALDTSVWWQKERQWRLSKVGLDETEAETLWNDAKGKFQGEIEGAAASLRERLEKRVVASQNLILSEH